MTAVIAVAMLAPAAQATTPAPGYSQFAGCPDPATEPIGAGVELCIFSTVKSGSFKMGSKTVPIEKPITVSGGSNGEFENFVANSKGGLSKAKQKVPGGVIGITGLTWLAEFLGSSALTLYATTELAGQPVLKGATDITLPIKVHLENTTGVLGPNCYVGSVGSPITLHMITGTTSPPGPNTPITGKNPEFSFDPTLQILHLKNGEYVDNSFSAPGASGCVLTLFGFIPINLNPLVNLQAGLPSPAGKNETRQVIDTEIGEPYLIYP
ncbi:MAG TPA: hypothetical protein VEW07_07925 [Solirubrobacterales bacterium]|nr:hypothetical protein [Solirubrobacterales bacterium]